MLHCRNIIEINVEMLHCRNVIEINVEMLHCRHHCRNEREKLFLCCVL